ncbi:hypothetical protein DICSQDRAFT_63901 [Dichomitus squalens LYAD-421 SS1]|uniref:Uncharacterized protein n=1 Tax=Dichomitus squalens (strain LYAD-421) TaxID=732165 RepID=R7SV75_DICSQ|nr:uncharacterized protein DICSQDRAFT_63901 [Dichomitus squalens LYAD-421 SS1]EJF59971.1 hypothetical protein DICSQDRAFT_63901 [Dichomitus squalens LYAD-421 SS1]
MVPGDEVEVHVKDSSEGVEEVGHKFRATVRGDVGRNSVLGEDVLKEQFRELRSVECIVRRDEDGLFGEPVDDNQDVCETVRVWQLLDEVHGDGVPWTLRDRELLEGSVGKVTESFGSRAGGTGLAVVLDKELESRPGVFLEDQGLGLVLAPVSGGWVIVVGPEDSETEVFRVRDVDLAIEPEEPFFVLGPWGVTFGGQLDGCGEFWRRVIGVLGCSDVGMQFLGVEKDGGSEDQFSEVHHLERHSELLLGEHQLEVVWVDSEVVAISSFWVDIPMAGECVGFDPQFSAGRTGLPG